MRDMRGMPGRASLRRPGRGALLADFLRSCFGGIGISFAVSLPVVLAILGVASDYAVMTKLRAELQDVADAAAIAGAHEIPLANADRQQVENAARMFAVYRLTGDSSKTVDDLAALKIAVEVSSAKDLSAVTVRIREDWSPFFAHFVAKSVTPIRVSSAARFVGHTNICVLGMAGSKSAVFLDKYARLTGNGCGVFSNSVDSDGIKVNMGATLNAALICSAGGVDQKSATLKPSPLTDCPAVADPLASRPPPSFSGCDYTNVYLNGDKTSLDPGVYCGGLTISGTSAVTLNPGIYVMKDGGLTISGSASVAGDGVGFYITGNASPTLFTVKTHVSFSAPKEGPMAGLLIFEDRNMGPALTHRISSDDARKLIGTIYLPVGKLLIDAKQPVADQSAYTAIIAKGLELNMGPNLILNSDFSATDVPVPAGIARSSQVILTN